MNYIDHSMENFHCVKRYRILISKRRGPFSGSKRGYDGMSNKSEAQKRGVLNLWYKYFDELIFSRSLCHIPRFWAFSRVINHTHPFDAETIPTLTNQTFINIQ